MAFNSSATAATISFFSSLDTGRPYQKFIINDVKKSQEHAREGGRARQVRIFASRGWVCDGQIGAVNAESIAERSIPCADLAMADGDTLLNDKTLEMVVVLRMTRNFKDWVALFTGYTLMLTFNLTARRRTPSANSVGSEY